MGGLYIYIHISDDKINSRFPPNSAQMQLLLENKLCYLILHNMIIIIRLIEIKMELKN